MAAVSAYTDDGQETFEFLTPSEGQRSKLSSWELRWARGTWAQLDYISLLLENLENPEYEKVRDNIDHVRRHAFPKSAWKRVWRDPSLADIKPKRGRPKQ
jgi:hypothetical protein